MRVRFGLSTLLAIVALTIILSWLSWNFYAGHAELTPVPAAEVEQFGLHPLPGKDLIFSTSFFGTLIFFPPYKRPPVDTLYPWGATGNVLVSLVLSIGIVFSLRRLWRWWRQRHNTVSSTNPS